MLQLDYDSQCRRFPGHSVLPLFCQGILDIEAHRRGRTCCLPISSSHGPCPHRRRPGLPRCSAKIESQFQQTYHRDVPLAYYASQHWLDHALFENVSLDIQDGLIELFDPNKPHFVVWAWICATFSGFSLQSAFNGVSRLVQRPLNDGVFR
jgi:hypothetical protein